MATIDTLIFDIDDTLYPVSCGFSDHRNTEVVAEFMVARLGFASHGEALELRNEVFARHHSTLKGLAVASAEGRLPRPFNEGDLGEWWAEHCEYGRFVPRLSEPFLASLRALQQGGMRLVAFSNSPRKYALRCLDAVGARALFPDEMVFGVEDVMPACKPEPSAFQKVFSSVGTAPERAVMFEDSMKNIRACKALGMHTVLVDESGGSGCPSGGEAALLGDVANHSDPAVDFAVRHIEQIDVLMPSLRQKRFPAGERAPERSGA